MKDHTRFQIFPFHSFIRHRRRFLQFYRNLIDLTINHFIMQLNENSMEDVGYLLKPENSKPFKKVIQMVRFLLVLTMAAMAALAIQFYISIK